MYNAMEDNRLYDFKNGIQTDVNLSHDDNSVDILTFLDDVQEWMEAHPNIIKEKYLPLSCIAVGLTQMQASAFLYGIFVGRVMERKSMKVEIESSIIDQKILAKKVKKNINQQMTWFKKLLKQIDDMGEEEAS